MTPLFPGSIVGIFGGGQLGRMIALEARRMGYRTVILDPAENGPAAQAADEHIRAPLADVRAARQLARRCDVLTVEWELIPLKSLRAAALLKPLYPSWKTLAVIQDRLDQKRFLFKHRFPQARFFSIHDMDELRRATDGLKYPCVLKRRRAGYDGKGQLVLRKPGDLPKAAALADKPCVLETWVPFQKEISVILARGRDGKTSAYPVAENFHRQGVLRKTIAPARISSRTARRAVRLARRIASALGHVGVMAVEMFLLKDGRLLVNEIAPRVHNSGHFTWGGCATSQFEQHLRTICGLPLGDARLLAPAKMVNLLGELWKQRGPGLREYLANPRARLHLYGKASASPGRKMGHVLFLRP